ncbi:MAG: 23S rRNA (uracil(1939)-C(5))-methyltransferase RlmD [Candidatus Woesearchaeota archaeon]
MAEPKCRYFLNCGGCSAQHIDYSVQLENKKAVLARAVGDVEVKVFSGPEYRYRNRMDFIFHANGIGFRKKGDWKSIVDVKECVISNDLLNSLAAEVREHFSGSDYFKVVQHSGTFRYAVVRTPQEDSSISFVLNSDSTKLQEAIEKVKEFAAKTSANNVVVTYVPSKTDHSISEDFFVVKGADMLREKYLGKEFLYSVQGFFQNNHVMAEKMQEYVHGLLSAHETSGYHLLDLYGGVGTFGVINADLFSGVTIVEEFQGSIDTAKKNININGCKNTKALCMDAKQLAKVDLPDKLFVITDPPRSGMHPKTIQQLNRLQPSVIIYISCNVQQLAKDIPKFREYKVKSAAMFDLFPQTPHSESVVELVRKE